MIHHFLENSAKAFPEKTAVITEKDRATYAQINSDANRLARLTYLEPDQLENKIDSIGKPIPTVKLIKSDVLH